MNRSHRQAAVAEWVRVTFNNLSDVAERGRRLLEETVELAQVVGVTRADAHRIVDYVFDRPPGVLYQELGGVGMCLLALAHSVGANADEAEQVELDRVLLKDPEHFRARQREKVAALVEKQPAKESTE